MNRGARRLLAALLAVGVSAVWAVPACADETRDKQWHLGFLKIAEAHALSQGDGVTVAVIDSGIDASHPDLAGNVLPGVDYVQPGGDGLSDTTGHGTAMAGLIVGHGRGDSGVLGIAPKAKAVSVREQIDHKFDPSEKYAAGIRWAIQHGVKVISFSISMGDTLRLQNAVNEALAADIVFVAGIGNTDVTGDTGAFPARYPGVIAVGGVDKNGNHEPISVVDKGVVLSAPATEVWSTKMGGGYRSATGTSDSTAIVAGVVALVRAKYPQMSAKQVYDLLANTAIDKGAPGRDPEFGYGIVNPVVALKKGPAGASSGASASAVPSSSESSGAAEDGGGSGSGNKVLVVVLGGVVLLLLVGGVTIAVVRTARR